MLFYFPSETDALLAKRVDRLKPGPVNPDDYQKRCVENGVVFEDFVKAVAWSSDPIIRAALARKAAPR
jgi:hypothetical protein